MAIEAKNAGMKTKRKSVFSSRKRRKAGAVTFAVAAEGAVSGVDNEDGGSQTESEGNVIPPQGTSIVGSIVTPPGPADIPETGKYWITTLPARRVRTTVTRSKPSKRTSSAIAGNRQLLETKAETENTVQELVKVHTPVIPPTSYAEDYRSRFQGHSRSSAGLISYRTTHDRYAPYQKPRHLPYSFGNMVSSAGAQPILVGDSYGPRFAMGMAAVSQNEAHGVRSGSAVSMLDSRSRKPFLRASDSSQHINELIAKYAQDAVEQDLWSPRRSSATATAPWLDNPGLCQLSRCQDVLEFMEEGSMGSREVMIKGTYGADQADSRSGTGSVMTQQDCFRDGEGMHFGAPCFSLGTFRNGLTSGYIRPGSTDCSGRQAAGGDGAGAPSSAGSSWGASSGGQGTASQGQYGSGQVERQEDSKGGGNMSSGGGRRLESLLDMADLDVEDAQISDWILDAPRNDDWAPEDWLTDGNSPLEKSDDVTTPRSCSGVLVRVGTNESSTDGGHISSWSSPTMTRMEKMDETKSGQVSEASDKERMGEAGAAGTSHDNQVSQQDDLFWKDVMNEWEGGEASADDSLLDSRISLGPPGWMEGL